jgi:hypothetical protein
MFPMISRQPLRWVKAVSLIISLITTTVSIHAQEGDTKIEAGAPLDFKEFAKEYTPPTDKPAIPTRYRLRIGFVRLSERAPDIRGITFVDTPPEIFRKNFHWIDVKAPLFGKVQAGGGKAITKGPQGEDLPRPHYEGTWAYLLPQRVKGEKVLSSIYFNDSRVSGWDYFLNLIYGARLEQSTLHLQFDVPLNKWVIVPEWSTPNPKPIQGSYLYFIFQLKEDK